MWFNDQEETYIKMLASRNLTVLKKANKTEPTTPKPPTINKLKQKPQQTRVYYILLS